MSVSDTDVFPYLPEPMENAAARSWANDLEERLVAIALERGFHPSHTTKKTLELVCPRRRQVVYLNRTRLHTPTIAVVAPPWTPLDDIRSLPGVTVPVGYYHNTDMRTFPRHVHGGRGEIPYGYSIVCADLSSFARLLDAL